MLNKEPTWEGVPVKARPCWRCLVKDPKLRLRDIGDALALVEPFPASGPAPRSWLLWSAVLLLVASMALAFISFREKRTASPEPVRLHISVPDSVNTAGRILYSRRTGANWHSPQSGPTAFRACGSALWIRSMSGNCPEARLLRTRRPFSGLPTAGLSPIPLLERN